MGQENSRLKKMCCNNAFCNYDSNIENFTEVNRNQSQRGDQGIMRGTVKQTYHGQKQFQESRADVLADKEQRQQLADQLNQNALFGSQSSQHEQYYGNQFQSQSDRAITPDGFLQLSQDPQWLEYRKNLDEAAAAAKVLTLTITSSATLTKGERIVINALGLVSHLSKRTNAKLNADHSSDQNSVNQSINELVKDDGTEDDGLDMRDGFVFFGCKKSIKQNQTSLDQEQTTIKRVVNDFVIPNKNSQTAEQHRGRHFQIQFDLNSYNYFIKDLGVGYGVFVRQEEPIVLKDNMLINVGEAYIVVNIITGSLFSMDTDIQQYVQPTQDQQQQSIHLQPGIDVYDDDGEFKLKLKIFGGPSAGEIYYYKDEGQTIIIGRTPECNIRISDRLLSKHQASIQFFKQEQAWVLTDGFGGKPSTNGTWMYLNEDFLMQPGMVFKANQTIFQVDLK